MEVGIIPNVYISINTGESVLYHSITSIAIDALKVRSRRNPADVAGRKGPSAPLLGVSYIKHIRNQTWSALWRSLIEAVLGTSGVKIRSLRTVSHICPVRLVLCPKTVMAIKGSMIKRIIGTDRIYVFLDVIGVISEVDPRLSISSIAQSVVHGGDALRCIRVGHIATEVEEVRTVLLRIPVQFLPCACRVVKGSAN